MKNYNTNSRKKKKKKKKAQLHARSPSNETSLLSYYDITLCTLDDVK